MRGWRELRLRARSGGAWHRQHTFVEYGKGRPDFFYLAEGLGKAIPKIERTADAIAQREARRGPSVTR